MTYWLSLAARAAALAGDPASLVFPSGGGGSPGRDGDPGVPLEEPGGGGSSGEPPILTGERGGLGFPPASVDFFVCAQHNNMTMPDVVVVPYPTASLNICVYG